MLLAGCTKTTLSGISNQCRYCQVGSKLITLPVVLPVRQQQQQQGEYVVLDECDDVDDDNEHSGTLKMRDWNMQDRKIWHQLGTRKVGNTAS